jgi:hypothetical protein
VIGMRKIRHYLIVDKNFYPIARCIGGCHYLLFIRL